VTRDDIAQLLLAAQAGGLSFYGRIDTAKQLDAAVLAYHAALDGLDVAVSQVLQVLFDSGAKDMPSAAELRSMLRPSAHDWATGWGEVMARVHRYGLASWHLAPPMNDPVAEEVADRFGARAFCLLREGTSDEATLRAQFRDAYRSASGRHLATDHGLALDDGTRDRLAALTIGRPVAELDQETP
jgi:hypothetical protein